MADNQQMEKETAHVIFRLFLALAVMFSEAKHCHIF